MHTTQHHAYTVQATYNNGTQTGTIPGTRRQFLTEKEADHYAHELGTGEGYKVEKFPTPAGTLADLIYPRNN